MNQNYAFFIIFIIFIVNVSSTKYNTETADISGIITSLKNEITNIKNNLIDEQIKTVAESYDGENIDQIATSGSYHYTGEIMSTITIQKDSGIVHLYLENAKLSNPDIKIIVSKKGVNLIITLIGENTISNPSETSSNAISVSQDITINGKGFLTIISSKNGIKFDFLV